MCNLNSRWRMPEVGLERLFGPVVPGARAERRSATTFVVAAACRVTTRLREG